MLYLPRIPNSEFKYGGLIYLNEISNTEVKDVQYNSSSLASLSSYGTRVLSYKLENHLLRPKAG